MSVIRTRSSLVLVLMAGIGLLLTGCPPGGEVVFFSDEELKLAVRQQLQLPLSLDITKTELLELHELNARNVGVEDLEGLQFALNLTWLDVSNETSGGGGITNISQLARLRNLTFLDLSDNDITDVSPVAGLSNLNTLLLAGNDVFNIAPIVTNAENGGLGNGNLLSLECAPLEGPDGAIRDVVQQQIGRLKALGVDVVLVGCAGG